MPPTMHFITHVTMLFLDQDPLF